MRSVRLAGVPCLEPLECELPPRSVLYRIPPLGLGTGQAEGLLSYLVRVAAAHSVNPRRMVREVFASDNPEFKKLYGAVFFIRDAGTINGLGKYAELFLAETTKLTTADFLRPMTLLPLQALLPPNGQGLLAHHPHWCPLCLRTAVESGSEAYRPLAWSLALYRVCLHHGVRMAETCPYCRQTQPFIPRYPDMARCDHCGRLLWKNRPPRSRKSALDQWAAEAITDLVVHLTQLDGLATADRWVDALKTAARRFADGNRAKFCRQLGLQCWEVKGWFAEGEHPSLPQLLRTAYGMGIQPSDIFLGKLGPLLELRGDGVRAARRTFIDRARRPLLGIQERRKISRRLAAIARDTDGVWPLAAIARSLGLTRSCLKYWFPDYCAAITRKCRDVQMAQAEIAARNMQKVVVRTVRTISQRGEYPSRRKVTCELSHYGSSLARPDLLFAYRQAMNAVEH